MRNWSKSSGYWYTSMQLTLLFSSSSPLLLILLLPPSPHPSHSSSSLLLLLLLSLALLLSSLSSQLCLSYPEEVIVPLSSSDQDIKKVASFRHLGRFPVLAFHHKKNQVSLIDLFSLIPRLPGNKAMHDLSAFSSNALLDVSSTSTPPPSPPPPPLLLLCCYSLLQASLVRCGQPLCGPTQKRCKEDVQMLNACLASLSRGKILDIRPQSIAQSHTSKGRSSLSSQPISHSPEKW